MLAFLNVAEHLCLFGRYNLNVISFGASQRHLVTHNLVFHGVLEWGVEQYVNALALDEPHLNNSFPETSVAFHFYYYATLASL